MAEPLSTRECVERHLDEHGLPDGESNRDRARAILDEVDWSGKVHTVADYVGKWRRGEIGETHADGGATDETHAERDDADGQRASEPEGAPETPFDDMPDEPLGLNPDTDDAHYDPEADKWIVYLPRFGSQVEIDAEIVREMRRAYSNEVGDGETINSIAERYGWSAEAFKQLKRALGWTHDQDRYTREEHAKRDTDDLVRETLNARRGEYVRKRNEAIWERIRDEARKWRKFEQTVARPLIDQLQSVDPPGVKTPEQSDDFAAVLFPTDGHLDQENADGTGLHRNRQLWFECHATVISRIQPYGDPEVTYLALGSDMWNVDRDDGKTTAGTSQHNDRRAASTVGPVAEAGRELIELTRGLCDDLRVLVVPGNHDRRTCQLYHWALQAIYEDTDDVSIVGDVGQRQYATYGDNLLIFAHGDHLSGGQTRRSEGLAATASNEVPSAWGGCPHRYAHTGHRHSYEGDDDGIWLEQAPTSTPVDEYHDREGYIRSQHGQVAWLYEHDGGMMARPSDLRTYGEREAI